MNVEDCDILTGTTDAEINCPLPSEVEVDKVGGRHNISPAKVAIYFPTARFSAGVVTSSPNTKASISTMCYYSSISVGFKIIETRFGVRFIQTESHQPVFSASAFSCPLMPVITDAHPDVVTLMNWGLIPSWVKDQGNASRIKKFGFNARCETIYEKSMFRQSIKSKRCLVVVDGFFEWRYYNKQNQYF